MSTGLQTSRRIGVKQLTFQLQRCLYDHFRSLEVTGEISSFKVGPTGHWHFSIVEGSDSLKCIIFESDARRFSRLPKMGERVVLWGNLRPYGPQSSYSLQAKMIKGVGDGERQAELQRRRKVLAELGLLDPARKRPLPFLPARIGVVTSASGSVLQDIRDVVQSRFPGLPILLSPTRVQGDVEDEVIAALHLLGEICPVILLVRGGGSKEDLAVFDGLALAQAVAACPVPVVSGIGHGTDQCLVDLVADLCAATPSQAAELVVPERRALLLRVQGRQERLVRAVDIGQRRRRERVKGQRPRHPQERLDRLRQRSAELGLRLVLAIEKDQRHRMQILAKRAAQLDALSPLRVLQRGYTLTRDAQGALVFDAAQLRQGQALSLRFAAGQARVVVKEIL